MVSRLIGWDYSMTRVSTLPFDFWTGYHFGHELPQREVQNKAETRSLRVRRLRRGGQEEKGRVRSEKAQGEASSQELNPVEGEVTGIGCGDHQRPAASAIQPSSPQAFIQDVAGVVGAWG
jgi:hypothetical protein